MKVTVYSSDPIEDALRVVGSMYGVQITVSESEGQSSRRTQAPTSQPRSGKHGKAAAAAGTASKRRTARPAKVVSIAEVRAWARANGHQVSDRGRIPAQVVAAYTAAV